MLNFCGIVVAILKMETGRNYSEASVHIIFFWWQTGPYTAIWPSVPWPICYIMKFYFSGYIKLNSYLNKIGFNSSNLCDTCQQEETVEHFLLKCKLYDTYRKTMIDQLLQLGVTNFNLIILLSAKIFNQLLIILIKLIDFNYIFSWELCRTPSTP